MDAALAYVAEMGGGSIATGRDRLIENAERLAAITRAAAVAGGLALFAPDAPAAAMTAIKSPEGVSATEIVKRVKADFGGILSDGQGEMKGRMFRIAHLGYFDYLDAVGILAALEQVLVSLAPSKFRTGTMVEAAQRAHAEQLSAAAIS